MQGIYCLRLSFENKTIRLFILTFDIIFYTANKVVKRCTIQITVSCISLLNMLIFLFLNQAQVSWLKMDLSKEKRRLFPDLCVIPTVFCCYTVSQTQDHWVSFLLCFGMGSPFPCLGALDSSRPSCGAERERISHESLQQPALSSVRQGGTGWARGSFNGQGLQFSRCRLTGMRVLTLWACQVRRRSVLCSKFSRSLTTE